MFLKYPEYVIMISLFVTIVQNIITIKENNNVYNIIMDIIIFCFCLAELLFAIGVWP